MANNEQTGELSINVNAFAQGSLMSTTAVRQRWCCASASHPAPCVLSALPLAAAPAARCWPVQGRSSQLLQTDTMLVGEEDGEMTVQRGGSRSVQLDGCPACSCSTPGVRWVGSGAGGDGTARQPCPFLMPSFQGVFASGLCSFRCACGHCTLIGLQRCVLPPPCRAAPQRPPSRVLIHPRSKWRQCKPSWPPSAPRMRAPRQH